MRTTRLVVVGASGVIGGALFQAACQARVRVVGTALSRLREGLASFDMGTASLRSAVPDIGPGDVVFLLAGFISPAWVFAHPEAARHLNLESSKRLVDEVDKAGARLVFMSSDQVFSGEIGGYLETATPQPSNLYGRLKAMIEDHVLATKEGVVARTGWNVGWEQGQHCPVVQCYETLLKPEARMADDNFFNVTDVEDTARALLTLAAENRPAHRIYHLVSAPEISRAELAATIKATSRWGDMMQFETVPFASIPYSEPRPKRAFLRSECLGTLKVDFEAPNIVVRRKVAMIDRWRAESMVDSPGLA